MPPNRFQISVESVVAREPADLERAFSDIAKRGFNAAIVAQHPMRYSYSDRGFQFFAF